LVTPGESDKPELYWVATALLDPKSEFEWTLLRNAALGVYDDGWADQGAIQTLKLIASTRSRRILEEVPKANPRREDLAARAIAYIDSHPAPLEDADLNRLASRVAQAVKIGQWVKNDPPRYNARRDRALVNSLFTAARDNYIYSATYRRQNGLWKLCGIRETLQQVLPPPPPPSSPKP
jgi:hypothetical protein